MKLLVPILTFLFLFATSSATFAIATAQNDISLMGEDTSGSSEDSRESQDDDIWETELLAYLINDNCTLPNTLKKQGFISLKKAYVSVHHTFDNPPPEA